MRIGPEALTRRAACASLRSGLLPLPGAGFVAIVSEDVTFARYRVAVLISFRITHHSSLLKAKNKSDKASGRQSHRLLKHTAKAGGSNAQSAGVE